MAPLSNCEELGTLSALGSVPRIQVTLKD